MVTRKKKKKKVQPQPVYVLSDYKKRIFNNAVSNTIQGIRNQIIKDFDSAKKFFFEKISSYEGSVLDELGVYKPYLEKIKLHCSISYKNI